MPTSTITIAGGVAGISLAGTLARTADGQIGHQPTLGAAVAGTLSASVVTASGHSFQVGEPVTLFWAGGLRYGLEVSAVNGDDVTIADDTWAGGAALPANGTAVWLAPDTVIDTDFDASLMTMLGAVCAARALVAFRLVGGTAILALDLAAGEPWLWATGSGVANPLGAQAVDRVTVAQSGTAATKIGVGILYDSTS